MKISSLRYPFLPEQNLSINNKKFDFPDLQPTTSFGAVGRKRKRELADLDYEDTLPEEYAGPVYRGKFWLISDEFTKHKRQKQKTSSSETGSLHSGWDEDFPSPQPPPLQIPHCNPKVPHRRKAGTKNRFGHTKPFEESNAIPPPVVKKSAKKSSNHRKQRKNKPEERIKSRGTSTNNSLHSGLKSRGTGSSEPRFIKESSRDCKEHQLPRKYQRDTSLLKKDRLIHEAIENKMSEGQLVDLFCNHCNRSFQAKPTYRPKFMHYLVNHACSGLKRHQYVLGVKHRKCQFQCEPSQGCIFLTA